MNVENMIDDEDLCPYCKTPMSLDEVNYYGICEGCYIEESKEELVEQIEESHQESYVFDNALINEYTSEFYEVSIDKNQAREMFSLMYTRYENRKNKKALAYVQGMKDTLKVLGIDENALEDFMHGEGILVYSENIIE